MHLDYCQPFNISIRVASLNTSVSLPSCLSISMCVCLSPSLDYRLTTIIATTTKIVATIIATTTR